MAEQIEKEHNLQLFNRKKLEISGVVEVISSQDGVVSIKTNCGGIQINGHGLRIGKLDLEKGLLEVEGNINAIKYVGASEKKSFFARIFK